MRYWRSSTTLNSATDQEMRHLPFIAKTADEQVGKMIAR